MSKNKDIFAPDIALARQWYGDKRNISGVPVILHVQDAAESLKRNYKDLVEIDSKHFRTLYLAALGHDLFEDTEVKKSEVEKYWGMEVVNLITLLTNMRGDKDFTEYIEILSKSEEDVRLIKLVDIISNLNNSLKTFDELDKKWVASFWIPLLDQYNEKLLPVPWNKYKHLASSLTQEIKGKIILLKKRMSSVNA
jgi:(p)ppGpp synthase/HD superfamily hydrolase